MCVGVTPKFWGLGMPTTPGGGVRDLDPPLAMQSYEPIDKGGGRQMTKKFENVITFHHFGDVPKSF